MRFAIGVGIIGICFIVGLVYIAFYDTRTAVKIEMKEPNIIDENSEPLTPKYYQVITYPQYYSFKDMLIRVDAPVDNVRKVTVERKGGVR